MGYPTKIQLIKRKESEQWYINFPFSIAKAMEFEKGEVFEWTIEDKGGLTLQRKKVPLSTEQRKKVPLSQTPRFLPPITGVNRLSIRKFMIITSKLYSRYYLPFNLKYNCHFLPQLLSFKDIQ